MKLGLDAMLAGLAKMGGAFHQAAQSVRDFGKEADDYRRHQRIEERNERFGRWLYKNVDRRPRRYPKPGFLISNDRIVGRAVAPWLPNVKGMRYQNGKLIPRKSA